MILKLGEAGVIRLLVSSQILQELDTVLRKKAPDFLGALSLILDRSDVKVVTQPSQETIKRCEAFVQHTGDALIIASAWENDVDYFVTLDRKHFVDNIRLRDTCPFPIGTPGDFLAWIRAKIS